VVDDVKGGYDPVDGEQIRREVEEGVAAEKELRARLAAEDAARRKRQDPDEVWPPKFTARQLGEALHLNLKGDKQLFTAVHRGRLVFDNKSGTWFRFEGTKWVEDGARYHYDCAMDLADHYEERAKTLHSRLMRLDEEGKKRGWKQAAVDERKKFMGAKRDAFNKRAAALRDDARVTKLLKAAGAGRDSLGIAGDEWNQHKTLFATANVVLDLRTGKPVEINPLDYINQASEVEWQGLHAEAPLWDEFLEQAFSGDQELIAYVQRMAGYFLTGLTCVQEFWCLWGPRGRNGKGVFFRSLRAIMGNYYTTMPAALLLDQRQQGNSSGPREDLVHLRFKRCAVASESKKNARFSEDAIKGLTGDDPVFCRPGYGKFIEYLPEFKLLFVTNRIPSVDGGDQAFRERLRVIRFCNQFLAGAKADPEAGIYPQDPELEEKLKTELPGILAWAVRGAIDFLADLKLPPPDCVLEETDEHMESNDLVGEFIKDRLRITDGKDGNKMMSSKLYEAFREWCIEERHMNERHVQAPNTFGQDIKSRQGIKRVSPRNYVFYNVVLRVSAAPDADQPPLGPAPF